ncbi:MAG: zf-HC2 domain-containing protein, partial [Pseudomonadota bacterium]
MKTLDETDKKNHPKDKLLGFIDGTLSGEDHDMVRDHLEQCEECAAELASLGSFAGILKSEKQVFCPEPWEWYEFIENGQDPDGELSVHLENCNLCRSEVTGYNHSPRKEILPEAIKEALKKAYPETPRANHPRLNIGSSWITGWLSSRFRIPTLAFGAALAALLAVVMLYPRGNVPIIIGISPQDWEDTIPVAKSALPESAMSQKRSKAVGGNSQLKKYDARNRFVEQTKPKLATIVLFHGFEKPLPQSTVDSIYEALRPPTELEKRFEFLPPSKLMEFMDKITDQNLTPVQVLNEFCMQSSITFALLVNVEAQKDKFGLKSRII